MYFEYFLVDSWFISSLNRTTFISGFINQESTVYRATMFHEGASVRQRALRERNTNGDQDRMTGERAVVGRSRVPFCYCAPSVVSSLGCGRDPNVQSGFRFCARCSWELPIRESKGTHLKRQPGQSASHRCRVVLDGIRYRREDAFVHVCEKCSGFHGCCM